MMLPVDLEVRVLQKSAEKTSGLFAGVPQEMEYTGFILEKLIGDDSDAQLVEFPIMTVNPNDPKEKHVSIAFVNPKRPEIMIPGGKAIAAKVKRVIEANNPEYVLIDMPPTQKSDGLNDIVVAEIRQTFPSIEVDEFTLPGGRDVVDNGKIEKMRVLEEMTNGLTSWVGTEASSGEEVYGYTFRPVTQKLKSIWANSSVFAKAKLLKQRKGLKLTVEDLFTTGITSLGGESLWNDVAKVDKTSLYAFALGWEGPGIKKLPPNWFACYRFPEWFGVF